MTQYFPYGVKLSQGQMQKLSRAYTTRSPVTLRLDKSDLKGNNELMLTKTQINRIKKAMNMNKGVEIKISKNPNSKGNKTWRCIMEFISWFGMAISKKDCWTSSFRSS